jgi:hypothetical protein
MSFAALRRFGGPGLSALAISQAAVVEAPGVTHLTDEIAR